MEYNFEKQINIVKNNKYIAIIGVVFVLISSFVLICIGFAKYDTKEHILEKHIVTKGLDNMQLNFINLPSDTSLCILPYRVDCTPVVISEDNYNNTAEILLYISVLSFVSLALWGAFAILLKVLNFENEMNTKILDVQKNLFKEREMWKLTKEKTEYEYTQKTKELNSTEGGERGLKYREFDLEKQKMALKNNHELVLKDKEIQLEKENSRETKSESSKSESK